MRAEDLLVCSICHGALDLEGPGGVGARCPGCQRTYQRLNGFYDMTPVPVPDSEVQETWAMWEKLQDNAVVAYESDPAANLSVGRRRDVRLFAEFSELKGLTLDVGCGPQSAPSYGLEFDGRLVGIDPLAGTPNREFDFVQGVGEYLPFPDRTFDRVLFATSLDHMLVPTRSLAEARRVVKPDGLVSIWFGHHDHAHSADHADHVGHATPHPNRVLRPARLAWSMVRSGDLGGLVRRGSAKIRAARGAGEPAYMASLAVPDGAEDHFHAYHLTQGLVDEWITGAGLRTVRRKVDQDAGSLLLAAPVS